MKVIKHSGKPFKSGFKVNTVKCKTINPNTGKEAYCFYEDDSIVDVFRCMEMRNYVNEFENLFASARANKSAENHIIIVIDFKISDIKDYLDKWSTINPIKGLNLNTYFAGGYYISIIESNYQEVYFLKKIEKETIEGFSITKRELTKEEAERDITLERFQKYHNSVGEDFIDYVGSVNTKKMALQFGGFAMAKRPEIAKEIINTLNDSNIYLQLVQEVYEEFYQGEGNEFYEDFAEFLNNTKYSKERVNQVLIQVEEYYK